MNTRLDLFRRWNSKMYVWHIIDLQTIVLHKSYYIIDIYFSLQDSEADASIPKEKATFSGRRSGEITSYNIFYKEIHVSHYKKTYLPAHKLLNEH